MLRNLGFNNLPDQSTMAAITFSDKVVSHVHFSDGLLFHQLVHVAQYRQLGIPRFAELYVLGFVNGGSYEAIPLEVHADALGGRYENNHAQHFSVAEEVAAWIAEPVAHLLPYRGRRSAHSPGGTWASRFGSVVRSIVGKKQDCGTVR